MNRSLKKCLTYFIVFTMLLTSSSFALAKSTSSKPYVIYETKSSENVASGVVHENVLKFTQKGWWNINVLRIDLEDEYTEIKGLFNKNGLSSRNKVSNMVKDSNAVAGINGDYFEYKPFASPLGVLINDKKIISSPMHKSYALPAFVLDEDNNPNITFFDRNMAAISSSTEKPVIISAINKTSKTYQEVMLYNKNWGSKSIGNKLFDDLIEIVVVDDVVEEVRVGQEPINIPENGYILAGRERVKDRLLDNFKVGDEVNLKLTTSPNYENIKTAIGGGSIILKDGKSINSNINIKGNNPRTGIGITQDKKQLLIVTIDGRDTSFKGVSQEVFSQILKDLGAYDAINLDGGGSTTMVVKSVDDETPKVVNKPSDGGERRVVDGLGVFSNSPKGTLSSVKIYTDDNKMFTNTTRKFFIKGYDQYKNPISVDLNKAIFTVEGIQGSFNGNTLKANAPGTAKVTVNYEGKTDDTEIQVLGKVKDITTNMDKFYIDTNSQKNLGIFYGKDKDGFTSKIYPEDISWTVTGNIGYVKDGIFYSSNVPNSGAITAKIGDGIENILVSTKSSQTPIESFENLDNISFSSYPKSVTGKISSSDEAREKDFCLKLEYDFTQGDSTKAAYANFNQKGIALNGNPDKLGLWVYGDENGSQLRGSIVDSKGQNFNIDFVKNLNWSGWKYVTSQIPSNVSYPIHLQRIYVVETNPAKKIDGKVYIDGLVASYPPKFTSVELPKPSTLTDERNKKVEKTQDSFSFAVTSIPNNIDEITKSQTSSQIINKINNYNISISFGNLPEKANQEIKTNLNICVNQGYKSYTNKNTLFIKANSSKGSLRLTNPEQWIWLKHDLENSNAKNIVLLLPTPVFGNGGFTDKLEAELLHDTLKESKLNGKDIWIIHGGNKTNIELKDGIRYVEINSKNISEPSNINNLKMIEFMVNQNNITYQIKPIF